MLRLLPRQVKFDGYPLVTGFHGIGVTGYWTVKYLVHRLNARRVAFIDYDKMVPVTSASGGRLTAPYEIYQKRKLVFLKVEYPHQKDDETSFYREVGEWVMQSGFKEVALVGGLNAELRHDDTSFRLVHTSAYRPGKRLKSAKLLEDDHIVVGPVAILLNYFEMTDFPAYAVLAYASPERLDPRAVASSIQVLSAVYRFKVDVAPLIKGAEALEMEVAKQDVTRQREPQSFYT